MAKIVIDPGHGGSATIPGDSTWNNAVGPNGTLEKNLTLAIGLLLSRALNAAGHEVQLTRDRDVNLRLRDRAKVARTARAHAFVSIHFNGSHGHVAQGTETLVHTSFSPRSARLSLAVQDALLPVTKLDDRNKKFDPRTRIKPQALAALNPAHHDPSTAACLVEVSFLDRADEEKRLQDPKYLQAIASAIAAGIEAYTGPTAMVALADEADVGDAIEAESVAADGTADAVAFLSLNAIEEGAAKPPQADTADIDESTGKPPGLFSRAFVENTEPPLALIASVPKTQELRELVEFIVSLNLKHFTPDEILYMGASNAAGRCKDKNRVAPKELWKNITNTAQMLDAIRKELGAPIRILSCYRSPEYNSCVGGERGSLHMKFNAIDFTCSVGTPEVWRRVASRLRDSERRFTGGIGVYPTKRFVHIDTRGTVANWSGT